jgi:hypothetical protein
MGAKSTPPAAFESRRWFAKHRIEGYVWLYAPLQEVFKATECIDDAEGRIYRLDVKRIEQYLVGRPGHPRARARIAKKKETENPHMVSAQTTRGYPPVQKDKDEKPANAISTEAQPERRKFLRAAAVGSATILGAPYIRNAAAAETIEWKVQTSWPRGRLWRA